MTESLSVSERWDLVAHERLTLADLLDTLTGEQWATPSLCGAWTVKDIAAHLLLGPTFSVPEATSALMRGRGSINRASERMTAARSRRPRDQLVTALRERADSRFHPPMLDWHAPLTEVLVHREDIAVPLGLPAEPPREGWRHSLDFLVTNKARLFFVKGRLPDVRLVATDLDWAHGNGPDVTGPAAALGAAIAGRPAVLDRLSGPGLATLEPWVRR